MPDLPQWPVSHGSGPPLSCTNIGVVVALPVLLISQGVTDPFFACSRTRWFRLAVLRVIISQLRLRLLGD